MPMKPISSLALCLLLAACAAPPAGRHVPIDEARPTLPHSSPECLAANLPPAEPFPASAIPEAAMARRQSGWVAVRYDVVDGVARHVAVAASSPAGLYDAAALQHAARYRAPARGTVRGCVMVIDVRF